MKIAEMRGAFGVVATGGFGNGTFAGREGLEDGLQMPEDRRIGTHHHAVATFQTPDTTTGTGIHILNAALAKGGSAADIVFEVGVAAINNNVAC